MTRWCHQPLSLQERDTLAPDPSVPAEAGDKACPWCAQAVPIARALSQGIPTCTEGHGEPSCDSALGVPGARPAKGTGSRAAPGQVRRSAQQLGHRLPSFSGGGTGACCPPSPLNGAMLSCHQVQGVCGQLVNLFTKLSERLGHDWHGRSVAPQARWELCPFAPCKAVPYSLCLQGSNTVPSLSPRRGLLTLHHAELPVAPGPQGLRCLSAQAMSVKGDNIKWEGGNPTAATLSALTQHPRWAS